MSRAKRLSVDLDVHGQVVGSSVEWRQHDQAVEIVVVPVGPFDTPQEALCRLMWVKPVSPTLW